MSENLILLYVGYFCYFLSLPRSDFTDIHFVIFHPYGLSGKNALDQYTVLAPVIYVYPFYHLDCVLLNTKVLLLSAFTQLWVP